jgi:hypothetical protein
MRKPTSTIVNSNSSVAAQETTPNIAIGWPSFSSPYKITVPFPRGMHPCDESNGVFSFRTDQCTDKTDPTFRVRRNANWDSLDPVAAFNDAFGQDLREAGIDSVSGRTATVLGQDVTSIVFVVNENITGAIVSELHPKSGEKPRRVSVEVHRKIAPTIDGTAQDVDAVLVAMLKGARFSVARVAPANNTNSTP